MITLLERFRSVPLGTVFADNSPVRIDAGSMAWVDLPPVDFLEYARQAPVLSFDRLPASPEEYVDGTTFLQAQAHRIWLTVRKASELIPAGRDAVMLNLGGYPFVIERVLRDYLALESRIISTYNQPLTPEIQEMLVANRIEPVAVNLDPYVAAGDAPAGIGDRLPLRDHSVDFVLMAHVIEHLYHPLTILKEAARVLRPGGMMLVTTDNGFMLGTLLQFLGERKFVHEPVEGTAAMVFHNWRGHVRYYSGEDLRTLMRAAGFDILGTDYYEIHYNSFPEEYFVRPNVVVPQWRANLLKEFEDLRNEVFVCGIVRQL